MTHRFGGGFFRRRAACSSRTSCAVVYGFRRSTTPSGITLVPPTEVVAMTGIMAKRTSSRASRKNSHPLFRQHQVEHDGVNAGRVVAHLFERLGAIRRRDDYEADAEKRDGHRLAVVDVVFDDENAVRHAGGTYRSLATGRAGASKVAYVNDRVCSVFAMKGPSGLSPMHDHAWSRYQRPAQCSLLRMMPGCTL